MKLPSLKTVVTDSVRTFVRFPVVLLVSIVGTIAAVALIGSDEPGDTGLFNVLLASLLGLPLLIALAGLSEVRGLPRVAALAVQSAAVVVLVAYALTLPRHFPDAPLYHLVRFFLLLAALHFLAAYAPYSGGGSVNGFWHFNKTLFIRMLTAALFSLVLYAGLALALAALDHLFGMEVPGRRYFQLLVAIFGVFNTWFFLSGVPEDLRGLAARTDYPRGLKVFTQNVLLPLVLLYTVILYAYAGKIVVEWSWPKGWVSGLILGFSVAGILSLLLLHPIRDLAENVWIHRLSRWFYVVLGPLVIVLALAGLRRVGEYGFTEQRYILIVITGWLAAITVYFLISKARNIKVIPGSLCVFGLLVTAGPWSAFRVSEKSQVERLGGVLAERKILADGKIQRAPSGVPSEVRRDISSMLQYLYEYHGYASVAAWFPQPVDSTDPSGIYHRKAPNVLAEQMGIEYIRPWGSVSSETISLHADGFMPGDVRGYDCIAGPRYFSTTSGPLVWEDLAGYTIRFAPGFGSVAVIHGKGAASDSVVTDLRATFDDFVRRYGTGGSGAIAPDSLAVHVRGAGADIKMFFRILEGRMRKNDVSIEAAQVLIALSPRE